ncbi:MAG: hypothetical protein WD049_09615 [Candidatus Paceibacterota bacterium]
MDRITGHSSTVRGWLLVEGQHLPLAQVGPGICVLREAINIAPNTEAQLMVEVDGDQRRRDVILHEGITAGSAAAKFQIK